MTDHKRWRTGESVDLLGKVKQLLNINSASKEKSLPGLTQAQVSGCWILVIGGW
jgi:hypothetical protein